MVRVTVKFAFKRGDHFQAAGSTFEADDREAESLEGAGLIEPLRRAKDTPASKIKDAGK